MAQDWLDGYFENKKIVDNTVEPAGGTGEGGDMTKAVYDPANIAQQVVGTTATQTLTNKTLTTPNLGTPSAINLTNATDATDKRLMTDAQETKLDSVATGADVTSATNIASITHAATGKTTPVDADELGLIDSAASNVLKKLTWANLKATLLGSSTITTAMIQLNAVGNARMAKMPLGTVKVNNTILGSADPVDMLLPENTVLFSDATGLIRPGVLGDKFVISGDDINVSPPSSAEILAAGDFLRHNALNQIIDENDVVISGTPVVANQAALPSASDYNGFTYRVANQGPYGIDYQSNGTVWSPTNGTALLHIGNDPLPQSTVPTDGYLVVANASITWTAANNGSGKVRLTSSGAHGITEADGEGCYLYLISGGTGWTAGTFHQIIPSTGYIDTTHLDLETAYTGGMGVPVFARVNVEVPLITKTIPVLRENTSLHLDVDTHSNPSAIASTKTTHFKLGSTVFCSHGNTSTSEGVALSCRINNQNSTSIQLGSMPLNNTGYVVSGATAPVAGTENTGAETTVVISHECNTAGIPFKITHYEFYIRG